MRPERKERIRLEARVAVLDACRRDLERVWLRLDLHRGLEGLARGVEEAHEAVDLALRLTVAEAEGHEPAKRIGRPVEIEVDSP